MAPSNCRLCPARESSCASTIRAHQSARGSIGSAAACPISHRIQDPRLHPRTIADFQSLCQGSCWQLTQYCRTIGALLRSLTDFEVSVYSDGITAALPHSSLSKSSLLRTPKHAKSAMYSAPYRASALKGNCPYSQRSGLFPTVGMVERPAKLESGVMARRVLLDRSREGEKGGIPERFWYNGSGGFGRRYGTIGGAAATQSHPY